MKFHSARDRTSTQRAGILLSHQGLFYYCFVNLALNSPADCCLLLKCYSHPAVNCERSVAQKLLDKLRIFILRSLFHTNLPTTNFCSARNWLNCKEAPRSKKKASSASPFFSESTVSANCFCRAILSANLWAVFSFQGYCFQFCFILRLNLVPFLQNILWAREKRVVKGSSCSFPQATRNFKVIHL